MLCHASSLSFAAAVVLHFFLKTCSNSPYERIRMSNSSGVKNAALLFSVAVVTRRIGVPLMLSFYSCGTCNYPQVKLLRVELTNSNQLFWNRKPRVSFIRGDQPRAQGQTQGLINLLCETDLCSFKCATIACTSTSLRNIKHLNGQRGGKPNTHAFPKADIKKFNHIVIRKLQNQILVLHVPT